MSEMGKMYYGLVPLEFGTPTGGGEPADPSVPVGPDVDGSYTIPGTRIWDFSTSGTFTPPAGVTLVHVMVVTGGRSNGGTYGGGCGGGVRVYMDVPVSGPVDVIIGGQDTASSFGALTAPLPTPNVHNYCSGWSANLQASGAGSGNMDFGAPAPGQNGVAIHADAPGFPNPFYMAGGGGGSVGKYSATAGAPGGSGGGGSGSSAQWNTAANGANGYGGGAGGGRRDDDAWAVGGSGRVTVWTEQTVTRDTAPDPIEPVIHAALEGGVMVGAYAIDPVAPVDTLGVLVPYPLEPQPTGEVWTDEETGETHPVLAWPEKGWTYSNGDWSP